MAAKRKTPGGVRQLTKLMEEAGSGGRGRHSPLYQWMQANYDDFAAMLADSRPSWNKIAAGFAAMELHDGQGRPPTGECVRKTWWSVRQARAKAEAANYSKVPQPLAPGEVALGVRLAPVSEPSPVNVQTRVSFKRHPETLSDTVATNQDRPAAESILAPPAFVARNTMADPARLILNGKDGDGLAHEHLPSDIVSPPSMTDQMAPGVLTDLGQGPNKIGAAQTGPSADIEPAAPAPTSEAAEALPDPLPIPPATLAPDLTADPMITATQEVAVIIPGGEKQSRFRLSRLWKKPA